MKKCSVFLLLMFSLSVLTQEKFEKEYRITLDEAPKKSIQFIQSIQFKKKIKWYAEESNDGRTFEAKTCHNKYEYSIEFNENGTLLDVEKKIKFSELNKEIGQKIKKEILKRFRKFKFKKIQIQYKGLESEIKKIFNTTDRAKINTRIFYELVIKGKKEKQYSLYEITFDEYGNFIQELKFKPSSSLNLEF